jgi:aspartate carbamoyltransferase catalytic subunit
MLNRKDIVSIRDFDKEEILDVLDVAKTLSSATDKHSYLHGKILATVFYEPSTRTKISFNVAMKRLGGNVMGFSHFKNSSFLKGESFYDTMRILEGYCDIMALRAPWEGAARYAGEILKLPVINAGDGSNQHPTQTLLDLYTIRETQGRLDGLTIGMLGDLKFGRTVHSLIEGLSFFGGIRFVFISPPSLKVPSRYLRELDDKGIPYQEVESYQDQLKDFDILYVTRVQKERFVDEADFNSVKNAYRVKLQDLDEVQSHFRILHPLPRVQEIDRNVDASPFAAYFEQAKNGVLIREALIWMLLGR